MPGTYISPAETGLYYLQSRYYDPELGRFLNADAFASTGQGLLGNNMFAYCRNNPVSRRDVTGLADEDCISDETKEDLIYQPEGGSTGVQYGTSDGIPVGGFGSSGGNTVTLFRAMSPSEYANTTSSQQFAPGINSYEGAKYFATSYDDAIAWGRAMYQDGNYKVMQAVFNSQILCSSGTMYWPNLDGIGPAYLIFLNDLNNYMVSIS